MSRACHGSARDVKDLGLTARMAFRAELLRGGTLDGTGRDRMGRVRQPLFQGGATDEPVWLVCAVIRRFRRDFSACRAILHFDFWRNGIFFVRKVVQLPAYYRGIELR